MRMSLLQSAPPTDTLENRGHAKPLDGASPGRGVQPHCEQSERSSQMNQNA